MAGLSSRRHWKYTSSVKYSKIGTKIPLDLGSRERDTVNVRSVLTLLAQGDSKRAKAVSMQMGSAFVLCHNDLLVVLLSSGTK